MQLCMCICERRCDKCMHMVLYACVSECASKHVFVCLYPLKCIYVYMFLSVCLSVCLSVIESACVCVCVCVWVCMCQRVRECVCLCLCLSESESVCVCLCLMLVLKTLHWSVCAVCRSVVKD